MTITFDSETDLGGHVPVVVTTQESALAEPVTEEPAQETPEEPAAEADEETVQEETTGSEPHVEDEDWVQEIKLIGALAEAERRAQQWEARLGDLTEEKKEAKKMYDAAVLEVRDIAAEIVDLCRDKQFPQDEPVKIQAKVNPPVVAAPVAIEEEPTDWREASTEALLDGTKGLGKKKLEAIVAMAPTVGHLEDLRAEASRQCRSFKELLPKGCGQAIADAIEDRLVEHVANHDTPPAHLQVEPRVDPAAVEDGEYQDVTDDEPAAESEEDHAASWRLSCEHTAAEIYQSAIDDDWNEEDCSLDRDEDFYEHKKAGFDAFNAGKECYDFDGPGAHQRPWITGWVCAKRVSELQASESTDAFDDI